MAEGRAAISKMVSRNLRALRESRRMTYVELSERLARHGNPIPVLGLRRIERGERRVDVDDLAAIAAVLGVTNPWSLTRPVSVRCEVVITDEEE